MKQEDKWMKKFQERMDGYAEPIPEGLWDDIEHDLLTETSMVVPWWKRWQMAAAVALLLLVSSLTVWLWHSPVGQYVEEQSANISSEIVSPLEELVDETKLVADEIVAIKKHHIVVEEETNEVEVSTDSLAITQHEEMKEENVEEKDIEEEVVEEKDVYQPGGYSMTEPPFAMNKKRKSSWAIGFSAGNVMAYSSTDQGVRDALMMETPSINLPTDSIKEGKTGRAVPYHSIPVTKSLPIPEFTDYRHHTPITLGLSVRWMLDEVWSLESGLTYTYLSSDMKAGYYPAKQELHYVGIPLKINRSVWKNNRWMVYAGVGGAVEKCVSARQTIFNSFVNHREVLSENQVKLNELQWSLIASLGVQFKLMNQMGIYAEPGVVYYFDDGSKVETIRKEHPLNVNFQIGLRFSLGE